ncbi:MAG: sugar ABC transporter substrate-binding protein [bacterium]
MEHTTRHQAGGDGISRRGLLRNSLGAAALAGGAWLAGCGNPPDSGETPGTDLTIGVAFDTLQTEYWVASIETMRAELKKRNIRVVEAIADNDANRQFEQVNNFIAQGVDGIIIAPKDAQSVVKMIKEANRAGIPIVLYNRPPAESSAKSVTVVADNKEITKATVTYMADQAKASGRKYKAMILIGDLGDINAIQRRDGYDEVIKQYADVIEDTQRVPAEWNNEKALAGVTNALQANPDINFIFTSSDLHLPAIVSALKTAGKYKTFREEGHVMLGGFDGDAAAYQLLVDGYLDADGVQDMAFESSRAVQAILDLRAGKEVPTVIRDPGFVIHQDNLQEMAPRMWGANMAR